MTAGLAAMVAIRVVVGVWFVVSAIAKLDDRPKAISATGRYWLVPHGLQGPTTTTIIVIELVLGIGLLTGLLEPWTALLAAALLLAYAIVMSVDLVHGDIHACGCGTSDSPISWRLVGRNLLAALALVVANFIGGGISVLVHSVTALTIIGLAVAVLAVTDAWRLWRGMQANG